MWQIKVTTTYTNGMVETEFYNSHSKEEALDMYLYLLSIKSDNEEISEPFEVKFSK